MTRRKIVVLGAVLLLVGLAWGTREQLQNRVTVENRSGQIITVLRITIGGETSVFHDMPDGAKVDSAFKISSDDDHFTLDGRLGDGTLVRGKFGHVANGIIGDHPTFVVGREGGIRFRQSGVK